MAPRIDGYSHLIMARAYQRLSREVPEPWHQDDLRIAAKVSAFAALHEIAIGAEPTAARREAREMQREFGIEFQHAN